MRVVVAPGSFGPGLSAVEAARAIAEGWRRRAPTDQLILAPVSDGGAGYLEALRFTLGGDLVDTVVADPWANPMPAHLLVTGHTGYVEAAQVVDARSVTAGGDPERASTVGVGQLLRVARRHDIRRLVVGVGPAGVVTNDGGAGLLAGLGATSEPADALVRGAAGVAELAGVDLAPAVEHLAGLDLVLATDDEVPLLGLLGTTNAAGVARGLRAERLPTVDQWLERLADLVGRRTALAPGAGAGGGIGFGLLRLGARRTAGLDGFLATVGFSDTLSGVDLVVTGEQAFDLSAGSGHVGTAVAAAAGAAVRPCILLADRVAVGAREARALGIESAYGMSAIDDDPAASPPADRLSRLAERVARTWSWTP